MSEAAQAQAWLPEAAIVGARPRAAIEAVATQWAVRWMAGRGVKVTGWRLQDHGPSAQGKTVVRPGVGVLERSGARERLLAWALVLGDADQAASATDQRVLASFADRMLEDLAAALAGLLNAKDPADPQDEAVLVADLAGDNGAPLASLVLARTAVVALAKALAPPATRSKALLTPRLRAAAKAGCTVEAVLGRVRLNLGDLKALAPGDVLVLDTPLDGRVQLRAQASGQALALGRHDHHGDDRIVIL